jgi:hypothetical protein
VDGVEAAIAKAREIAGDKDVTIASASITQQALDLGLVDEVCVSLVPVLFGEGIPYFTKLDRGHMLLEDPTVVQGRRALHLRYAVPSLTTMSAKQTHPQHRSRQLPPGAMDENRKRRTARFRARPGTTAERPSRANSLRPPRTSRSV